MKKKKTKQTNLHQSLFLGIQCLIYKKKNCKQIRGLKFWPDSSTSEQHFVELPLLCNKFRGAFLIHIISHEACNQSGISDSIVVHIPQKSKRESTNTCKYNNKQLSSTFADSTKARRMENGVYKYTDIYTSTGGRPGEKFLVPYSVCICEQYRVVAFA